MEEEKCDCQCHIGEDGKPKTNEDHMWCGNCHENHKDDPRYTSPITNH